MFQSHTLKCHSTGTANSVKENYNMQCVIVKIEGKKILFWTERIRISCHKPWMNKHRKITSSWIAFEIRGNIYRFTSFSLRLKNRLNSLNARKVVSGNWILLMPSLTEKQRISCQMFHSLIRWMRWHHFIFEPVL